jgi:hypothetical protein
VSFIINKFITCEGRYNMAFHYHVQLMMHLKNEEFMNMSFFFLKSLSKMVVVVCKRPNPEMRLYHRGLINILIMAKLRKLNINWESFLRGLGRKTRERVILLTIFPKTDGCKTPTSSSLVPITSSFSKLGHQCDKRASRAPIVLLP